MQPKTLKETQGGSEGCNLGQRQIDEDDLTLNHMQAQIGMDPREDETGHERLRHQLKKISHGLLFRLA